MKNLILIRHGESEWNKLNLFTGWTNVDLSEKGVQEAIEAGKTLKENGYRPEICFTSYLKRAIKTLNLALEAMDMDWLPVYKSWRLNEKCKVSTRRRPLRNTATSKCACGAAPSTCVRPRST